MVLRRHVRGDKPLDDYDVEPAVVEASMFLVHTNLAKSMFATKRSAGLVECKNARQQFPQSHSLRFGDETSEQ